VRRLTSIATAFVASIALGLLMTPPVRAAAPTGTVRLLGQTAWVTQGAEFALRLAVTTKSTDDLELAVTVYPAVGSRSAFDETINDRVRGSAVSVKADPLSDLSADAEGAITVRLPIQDPAQARDPFRIRLRGAGVYPVVVELRGLGGGARVAQFTTHMINLPDAITGPKLATSLILPLAAPPTLQADGARRMTAAWSTSLRAVTATAETYADVPVTLLPQPETVQALALSDRPEDANTVAALVRATATRQILAGPYVRLAEPAFASGFESEEATQRTHGLAVLTSVLGTPPDTGIAVVDDGLDDATVNRLEAAHAVRAIVRERALAPIGLRTTLTQPFQLRGRSGHRLPAALADDGLAIHFNSKTPAILAAHNLLADLAVLYFDSPGVARGVVALPPPGWRASAEFLAPVFEGLRSSPVLAPVDASGLFASVAPATASARRTPLLRDAATPASSATLPATELRRARRDLVELSDLAIGENATVTGLEERVLTGQSADLRARQRSDYLATVDNEIKKQLHGIRVPTNQSITLNDRRARIPVTILRDVAFPVRVIVQLSSDRLQFPAGSTARIDLTRRNTTTMFTVQARASGTFPLEVSLKSPDGKVVLSTGRFTIRSRAGSRVGVYLSVGALCFLIAWWGRHIMQARRARRP